MDCAAPLVHKRRVWWGDGGGDMLAAVAASWALFFGIALLMLGNGLQGSLVGLRASLEGFPTAVTGVVMSCYFIGFLAGSMLAPKILGRVGHIRVFAALASLASTAALIHAVFVDPVTWGAMRLVTGFSIAGLYIVAESWLNDRATNETRGQLLSIYMVVTLGGFAGGQLLLNLADPLGVELFILASVMVSIALVPISLTVAQAPSFAAPAQVSLKQLYAISPLGILGTLGTGTAHGALFGMGAVYAASAGYSVAEVSFFMATVFLGGVILQWPIGLISDSFDRRRVITAVTFLAAASALAAIVVSGTSTWGLYALMGLFGGLSLPLYSLCIAHTNDQLAPAQMVAASASLVLVAGIGASFGPLAASAAMAVAGPTGYFWCLAAVHAVIGAFALYRMSQRATAPLDEQGPHLVMSPRVSPVAAALAARSVRDQMDRDLAGMSHGASARRR